MTREDLVQLIARALRRSFTFVSDGQARGAADTVLRDLKAVGIRILAPRPARNPFPPHLPEPRSTGATEYRPPRSERQD